MIVCVCDLVCVCEREREREREGERGDIETVANGSFSEHVWV